MYFPLVSVSSVTLWPILTLNFPAFVSAPPSLRGCIFCFALSGRRSCGDGVVQSVGDPIDFTEVSARENFEG
jgi:hypothetical protein